MSEARAPFHPLQQSLRGELNNRTIPCHPSDHIAHATRAARACDETTRLERGSSHAQRAVKAWNLVVAVRSVSTICTQLACGSQHSRARQNVLSRCAASQSVGGGYVFAPKSFTATGNHDQKSDSVQQASLRVNRVFEQPYDSTASSRACNRWTVLL